MKLKSWRSPKVERREGSLHGLGLFAVESIRKGDIVAYKAGTIVDENFVVINKDIILCAHKQIDDDLFLSPVSAEERLDILIGLNHSCSPNAYYDGQICVRAMEDIAIGTEITYDYATAENSITFNIEDCACNTDSCRRQIDTVNDWKSIELQEKYKGYFIDFIQAKIDASNISTLG